MDRVLLDFTTRAVFALVALLCGSALAEDCTVGLPSGSRRCCRWAPEITVIPVKFNATSFTSDTTLQTHLERKVIVVLDEWNRTGAIPSLRYDGRSSVMGRQSTFVNIYQQAFGPGELTPLARIMCDPSYCTTHTCIANMSGCMDETANGTPMNCENWCDFPGVRFNPDATWVAGYPTTGEHDFWSLLMHEMGHVLGHTHRVTDVTSTPFRCSVLGSQSGIFPPGFNPEQQRYLSRYDIGEHLSDVNYSYPIRTTSTTNLRSSNDLSANWSLIAAGSPSGGNTGIRPAVAFADGTPSQSGGKYCVAVASAPAAYGTVNHVLSFRGNGTTWDFSQPNGNLDGFTWAITYLGMAAAAGEDEYMLAYIATETPGNQYRVQTMTSQDCKYWASYEYVPGAYSKMAPALAYDVYYGKFIIVWVDSDSGELKGSVRSESTPGWSSPQSLGYSSALAPSISYSFGNNGALNFVLRNGAGQLCTLQMYLSGSGTLTLQNSATCSTTWPRDGLSGAYGYDATAGAWRYAITVLERDIAGGLNKIATYWKTSPTNSQNYSGTGQVSLGTVSPRTNSGLAFSFMGGFNKFMTSYSF